MNSSLPVPPVATSGAWLPGLSQPRVVATRLGNVSLGEQRAVGRVALDAEDLADLEAVVAGAAVERRDRRVVVGVERVVAAEAVDAEAPVERGVVVDALDARERLVALRPVAVQADAPVGVVVAGEQADERRVLGALARRAARRRHGGARRERRLGVDALHRAQQEDVVGLGLLERAGLVAVEVRGEVVEAEDLQLVGAVVRRARVEHVDEVVALGALAAGREDEVVVGVGLAVERERVPGAVVEREVGGARDDVGGLQVVDPEDVLAVGERRVVAEVAGGDRAVRAAHARLRADEDVAGVAERRAAGDAALVAELERVDLGVAPDLRDAPGGRVGLRRRARAERVAGARAGRHDAVGDDPAAQHDRRAVMQVEVGEVAEDVDAQVGQDLRVLMRSRRRRRRAA